MSLLKLSGVSLDGFRGDTPEKTEEVWAMKTVTVREAKDINVYEAQITLLLDLLEELEGNPQKDEIMKTIAECETMEEKLFYLLVFTS